MAKSRSGAVSWQSAKRAKYAGVASRLGAELLNVCVDSCGGGMASEAGKLVQAIGEEGERWSVGTWNSSSIERQLLGAIAVAVQRGNALTMLSGHTRTLSAHAGHGGGTVRAEGSREERE